MPFETPSFLQNKSVNEIHAQMKAILPTDIDVSEGGHAWNFTRPTALVVSRVYQYILPEVVKLIFPEYSYGIYLDDHAQVRGMSRRPAVAASGTLTITGASGTVIPLGSMFSTAAINEEPSIDYVTTEQAIIPSGGSIDVPITCTQIGTVGNTSEGTILFVGNKIVGITSVTNAEAVTGGTEEESDQSLIDRIVDYDRTQGESFVGNEADYRRWALSVPGVGGVVVISAQDDSGLVTLVITDSNGDPANEQLCEDVYNYIMRPDEPGARPAPVNAKLSVVPPDTLSIVVQATVELETGYDIQDTEEAFLTELKSYLPTAMSEKEIKYTQVGARLAATTGVNDYSDLKIGVKGQGTPGTSNISVAIDELPVVALEDITFTSGTVS